MAWDHPQGLRWALSKSWSRPHSFSTLNPPLFSSTLCQQGSHNLFFLRTAMREIECLLMNKVAFHTLAMPEKDLHQYLSKPRISFCSWEWPFCIHNCSPGFQMKRSRGAESDLRDSRSGTSGPQTPTAMGFPFNTARSVKFGSLDSHQQTVGLGWLCFYFLIHIKGEESNVTASYRNYSCITSNEGLSLEMCWIPPHFENEEWIVLYGYLWLIAIVLGQIVSQSPSSASC